MKPPKLIFSIDQISPNQTRELLTKLTQGSGTQVCASRSAPHGDDQKFSVERLRNGIANNHAYQIQGYDPVSDQVQLRNPWHRGDGETRGGRSKIGRDAVAPSDRSAPPAALAWRSEMHSSLPGPHSSAGSILAG